MGITDLSSYTSKQGVTTAVWRYDEADTFVVQHDFMHLSFFVDDFREFVDTLTVALRTVEKMDNPVMHIHPVTIREADLAQSRRDDFGLGFPVHEDEADDDFTGAGPSPVLTEVSDRP